MISCDLFLVLLVCSEVLGNCDGYFIKKKDRCGGFGVVFLEKILFRYW